MKLMNRSFLTLLSIAVLLAACNSMDLKKSDQAKTTASKRSAQTVTVAPPTLEAPTTPNYQSVWDRIRDGFALPQVSNNAVDTQIRFYTSKKAYFYKVMQESEPYLYFVANEMQANDMPMELALLPFIESSYNPTASSPGNRNVGIWQFGAATAHNYGLAQNTWYDGRKDVVASTEAAIQLLKKLYVRFDNDWLLAIAAYNAGEGTIQQAIDKNRKANKPIDFWSLPLNKTTQGYIPQLLALSKIVGNPHIYDFQLYPIQNLPYFVKVNVDTQINLADAAKNSALDVALIKKLNAGFKGGFTDPTKPRHVLIPIDAAAAFRLQLDAQPKVANIKWQEHVAQKGDTLLKVAKKYGVDIDKLKSINNLKSTQLAQGQRLQIPITANANSNNADEKLLSTSTSSSNATHNHTYTVKSGESLWTIAKSQNTAVESLARLNNLNAAAPLKVGQKLTLLTQASERIASNQKKLSHKIKAGDTLGAIAEKYDVSVKQLMQWNSIDKETSIRPNQELIILVEAKP